MPTGLETLQVWLKRDGTRKKLDLAVTICTKEGNTEVLVFNRIITHLRYVSTC
jgi:hypothetical protein